MIRAVIFDLWGTLIIESESTEERRVLRAAMAAEALRDAGEDYAEDVIGEAFERAGQALSRVHAEGLDLSAEGRTALYLRTLDETLPDRLDEDAWRRLHTAILTPALHVPPTPLPGARKALDDVKALGLPAGLISNTGITPGFVLRELLDRFGLLDALDRPVFSDEVEMSKPSAAIFEHALDLFGLEPQEAAFVGDQPILDVLGPMNAGLWSVQVGDIAEDGIVPHARVASVEHVVGALRELGLVKEPQLRTDGRR